MIDPTHPAVLTFDAGTFNRAVAAVREAFTQIAQAAVQAAAETATAVNRFVTRLREQANEPRTVDRIAMTYYVRAGMDPRYTTEPQLHGLIDEILSGEEPGMLLLTRESRARVAAQAVAGWVSSYDAPAAPLCWHRYLASTRIEVVA